MQDPSLVANPRSDTRSRPTFVGLRTVDLRRAGILGIVFAMTALVFVFDITVTTPLAAGVLYVPLVLTASQFGKPRPVWVLAGIACVLTLIGYVLPDAVPGPVEVVNRALSVGIILLAAFLVSEQMKASARLANAVGRAEAAEAAKTQLLTDASHDFRNSLNAVLGFTELLKEDCLPQQRDALAAIEQGGRRLLDGVENLIDLTALDEQGPCLTAVDLSDLLGESIANARITAMARSVTIVRDPPFDSPRAFGDQWAVRRIIDNLLQNAVKFSPIGGRIRARILPLGMDVGLEIADDGCGMRPETITRIGQPLAGTGPRGRHDADGLGIGLALAVKLTRLTGGDLDFMSEPGRGTVARLTLPIAE